MPHEHAWPCPALKPSRCLPSRQLGLLCCATGSPRCPSARRARGSHSSRGSAVRCWRWPGGRRRWWWAAWPCARSAGSPAHAQQADKGDTHHTAQAAVCGITGIHPAMTSTAPPEHPSPGTHLVQYAADDGVVAALADGAAQEEVAPGGGARHGVLLRRRPVAQGSVAGLQGAVTETKPTA